MFLSLLGPGEGTISKGSGERSSRTASYHLLLVSGSLMKSKLMPLGFLSHEMSTTCPLLRSHPIDLLTT